MQDKKEIFLLQENAGIDFNSLFVNDWLQIICK